MTRYVIERVLYRLSRSKHKDRFILKGAMLFSLWAPVPYRATGDLDLLGLGENSPSALAAVFAEILATPVEDDGIIFKIDTLQAAVAREEEEYPGVRLTFMSDLAGACLPILIDIGFGDAITPGPVAVEYPSLLGQEPPRLKAYPPETVVAEKFQAMVTLAAFNSRLKDFFDLWLFPIGSPSKVPSLLGLSKRPFTADRRRFLVKRQWRSQQTSPRRNKFSGSPS